MEHPAVDELVAELARCGWVSDLWLHGSLATGDHSPGISDIDLVALTARALGPDEVAFLSRMHRHIDQTVGRRCALGCAYVDVSRLDDLRVEHPTWTHGRLVERRLSAMVRVELLDHGRPLLGRAPSALLAPMSRDDIRTAVREELTGYWSWALRRPWLFLDSRHADLALVSMARARIALATGTLVTKTEALAQVRAPAVVVDGLRRRRTAGSRRTPIAPLLAHHAWHDTRRTIGEHGRPS